MFVAAFVLWGSAAAIASTGTVVSSSSETYPIGTSLNDDSILSLTDDAVLAVMLSSGRIIKVLGPFEGAVSEEVEASETVMAKLGKILLEMEEEVVVGGARGVLPPPVTSSVDEIGEIPPAE